MDELYINNVKADLTGETISLNYKNNLLGEIGALQSSFSYTIELPKTIQNCSIFKMAHIPNVRTINGTKVIGETLQVKYLKDGINILGDAVGYLDRISEDAYEISLSFGFLGKFSKWIEEGKTLNDFDFYNDANALTIMYDNELTDYPDEIDSLPNIFKPYYNPGVEMDEQAQKQIARLPAVRVPYYIQQIENETKCKFVFPENVAEKLKYLAMPLVSKKKYYKDVSFNRPTIINSVKSKFIKDFAGTVNVSDYFTTAGITYHDYSPEEIEGSFTTETITVRGSSVNSAAVKNKNISVRAIIPNSDTIVYDSDKTGIVIKNGGIYLNFPADIKGTYNVTTEVIDGTETKVLPNKTCKIKFCKFKKNERDNVWDLEEVLHSFDGEAILMEDDRVRILAESLINNLILEDGFSYGLIFQVCIYHRQYFPPETDDNGNKTYPDYYEITFAELTQTAENEGIAFGGAFSFEPSIKGISADDLLPGEDIIQAKGNLPDIEQVDFLQTLCNMFGVFPIINPRPKQDDETGRYVVEFVNIETLNANKTIIYRNGMPVNDWTDRLVTTTDRVAVATYNDNYGRRNIMKYKDDEKVKSASSAFFDIDDSRLDAEKVLIDLEFAPADDDTIPMYTVEKDYDDNGVEKRTYTLESITPRIMNITPVDVDDVAKAGITFSGLSFDDLKRAYYNPYIKVVQGWRVLTVRVILDTLDLANLDYTLPVYLKQFSQWFGVVSVQADSDGDVCNVELLPL